jgi:hypothetical protein
VIENANITTLFAYEESHLEKIELDKYGSKADGTVKVQGKPKKPDPNKLACRIGCTRICSRGALASIPSCITSCLGSGPGEIICAPVCCLVFAYTCGSSCNLICRLYPYF